MEYKELAKQIEAYAAIPRVCGFEGKAVKTFYKDLKKYCDKVKVDKVGNVIGTINGSDSNAPSLMIFAHIDTIGFVVKYIHDDGFITVEKMGGVPEKLVQGTPVIVTSEKGINHPGVIGARAYQTMSEAERNMVDPLKRLTVDLGVKSAKELKKLGIEVGCPVSYYPVFYELENNRICGTYLDNAVGMVELLWIAKQLKAKRPKATIHLVGTVWEEFNSTGAMLAARSIDVDMAICLLAPGCGDTPDQKAVSNVKMDNGPCVTITNFHDKSLSGQIVHKGMFEHLLKCGKKEKVNIQRCVLRGALSDSAFLQLEKDGIPVMDMGAPDRYSHSPKEVVSLKDVKETIKVLVRYCLDLNSKFSLNRFDI